MDYRRLKAPCELSSSCLLQLGLHQQVLPCPAMSQKNLQYLTESYSISNKTVVAVEDELHLEAQDRLVLMMTVKCLCLFDAILPLHHPGLQHHCRRIVGLVVETAGELLQSYCDDSVDFAAAVAEIAEKKTDSVAVVIVPDVVLQSVPAADGLKPCRLATPRVPSHLLHPALK